MFRTHVKTFTLRALTLNSHLHCLYGQPPAVQFRPSNSNQFTRKPKRLLSDQWKNACDQKRRAGVFHSELERLLQKSLIAYISNTSNQNFILNHSLTKRMRRTTHTRIRNRCVKTAYPQTMAQLGLSRMAFRRLANLGLIPGLSKV
jgi:ribosomal protein S14